MVKQIRVLAILPYEGLKEMLVSAAGQHREICLDATVGDMEKAVEVAGERMETAKYDVIIARGGTAELLRTAYPHMIILEISVTFDDIFRAVLLARNYNEKFAIVSLPAIAKRAQEFCTMLQYDIEVYAVNTEEESKELLENLQKQGYSMVVGDMINAKLATEKGMNVVLIMSGKNSVEAVLKQAVQLLAIKSRETEEKDYLKSICDGAPWYITILNRQGDVLLNNVKNSGESERYAEFLKENLNAYFEQEIFHMERRFGREYYVVDSKIIEGSGGEEVVIYGRPVCVEVPEDTRGIMLAEEEDEDSYSFESSFGVSNLVGRARETMLKCCDSRLPILILGEPGSGKDAAANSIYRMGYNKNRPFYTIDCEVVTPKEWTRFFEKSTSPLMEINCTIYFKNIQVIDINLEKKLRDMIENTNLCRRNQVIFSGTVKGDSAECMMSEYLLTKVNCILLQALPLRKRKSDVLNLSIIYLSALNAELGKQVIGFENGADEEMLQYSWPGNVTQLKRVLRELVIGTDGNYITRKSVKECISNEIISSEEANVSNINLNQSLNDITYDVIRRVMKEEGMNQKKAADRLKVSRTTIWRILNSR